MWKYTDCARQNCKRGLWLYSFLHRPSIYSVHQHPDYTMLCCLVVCLQTLHWLDSGAFLEIVRGGGEPCILENRSSFAGFFWLSLISNVKFGLLRGGARPNAPLKTPLAGLCWTMSSQILKLKSPNPQRWLSSHVLRNFLSGAWHLISYANFMLHLMQSQHDVIHRLGKLPGGKLEVYQREVTSVETVSSGTQTAILSTNIAVPISSI